MTAHPARLAGRLYEIRDTIRTIKGDRFPAWVAEVRPYIEGYQRRHPVNEIQAAMALCRGAGPVATLEILAAAVELVEPTEGSHD